MSDGLKAIAERYKVSYATFFQREMTPAELVEHHIDERALARWAAECIAGESKQTDEDFACQWYGTAEVRRVLKRYIECSPSTRRIEGIPEPPPADTKSDEFAEWFAGHLQLAIAKGIQIGRGLERREENAT